MSPQPSDLPDPFLDDDPTHIPPVFNIPFPYGIVRHTHKILKFATVSPWYFGSWESVYFDILYTDLKLQRFKIIIKPDLSDASLHVINMSEMISNDLMKSLDAYRIRDGRICEDALVYVWNNRFGTQIQYTGSILTSTHTNVITRWDERIYSLCPASGRFVYCTDDDDGNFIRRIVVVDLF